MGRCVMTRVEMLEKQHNLCQRITVYPQMQSVEKLAEQMGVTVQSVRGMILKMTARCLISEDTVNGKICFFFPDNRDKQKTLAYIQERINILKKHP